jgi:outer membrane protein assembly factor BamD (BamD/ComL family)
MRYLVDAMAKYEVHVARYYYRRGAYLAAANRAMGHERLPPRPPSRKRCSS